MSIPFPSSPPSQEMLWWLAVPALQSPVPVVPQLQLPPDDLPARRPLLPAEPAVPQSLA